MAAKNEVGVMAGLQDGSADFERVAALDLRVCQLVNWKEELWTRELAEQTRHAADEAGVRMTCFWAGWPGFRVWDFVQGPNTLGLVPPAYRAARIEALLLAADFAQALGVPAVVTHLGFIPENATDALFQEVVGVVRFIANKYKELGLEFWFETGQETPVTLLRLIESVATGNLGINLDPANLIMYGKGNPIDALDVFGQHVRNVHAKDGLYPTNPMKLGREVKVGEGKVRFPEFIQRLSELEFAGEYIIEREIKGEQQSRDIEATVKYLRNLLGQTPAE